MSHFNHPQASLCIVPGCPNSLPSNSAVQFFPVPVHVANIATAWYKNTMRTDLRASHLHRVCEQHFEESCFDYVGDGTKVLKPKPLPTLFDLEVFYKMIAYQESNKTIKKTNITFHTSNPDIDGKTLEPILKMNIDSDHVKTRLAPTMTSALSQPEKHSSSVPASKPALNHSDHFENKASNRCHVDGCVHNYVARRHRVQLYKISRDPAVARKWLDTCGFETIPVSPSTSTFKVCREHFIPSDFEGPATLRSDAVPSLFTTYSRSLMDQQNPNSAKRFRPDMANIRPKQSTPMMQNRRTSAPYRTSQSFSKEDEDQNSVILSSPMQENFDETMTHIVTDAKQLLDIDLSMNCSDEQLSDAQISHCAVKALDRTDNTNGMPPKVRNPVGRPRIHPRHPPPPTSTTAHRSSNVDDEIEEFDDWSVERGNRKSDREWTTNGQQDHRLSWSKKTTSTYSRHNNANQDRSSRPQLYPTRKTTVPYSSQYAQNTSNHTIQYAQDQPTRLKPSVTRLRDEGLDSERDQSFKRSLSKYYGQKPGRNCPLSDYGDYRSQCPMCEDVILENNIQLIIHLSQHIDSQRKKNNNTNNSSHHSPFEQIDTKCSYCHSEFSNPYFLAMHIDDKHMGEINDYSCRICDEHHSSLVDLVQHLNVRHGGLEMPYSCQVCSFRTSIYADMIYHIDEIHKGTRYFFCSSCFLAIELPLIIVNSMTLLNGTSAYKHLLLHENKIDQDRMIPSKFQACGKCRLHVPSIKDHLQRDHLAAAYHKTGDESEVYDDSTMDASKAIHQKTPTGRFLAATKSG